MTEKELIALMEAYGFTVSPDGKGGYDVLDSNGQLLAHYNSLPELIAGEITDTAGGTGAKGIGQPRFEQQGGAGEAGEEGPQPVPGFSYPEYFQLYGVIYHNNEVSGRIEKVGTIPEKKVPALTFPTIKDAEDYMDRAGLFGLEPYWDTKADAYKLREKTVVKPTLGFIDWATAEEALAQRRDPNLMVAWDDKTQRYYLVNKSVTKEEAGFLTREDAEAELSRKGDPTLMVAFDEQTQRYYLVNKPATPAAQKGYGTRADAEADLAVKGDPTLKIFFDTGTQRYFLSQPAEEPSIPEPYRGLEAPEFWTDPNTGQKFVRTTPEGAWQSFNEYAPSLIEQRDRYLAQGNVAMAQALETFRTQPTQAEALRLGMEIMQSPGDWWTYMKLSRGTQENVPWDVSREAIPRTWAEGLGFGQSTAPIGQMGAPGVGQVMQAPTTFRQPTREEAAQSAQMREWAINPWPGTAQMPQAPGITLRRPYVMVGALGPKTRGLLTDEEQAPGQQTKRYITREEAAQYQAQGLGSNVFWETSTTQPPTSLIPSGLSGFQETWPEQGEFSAMQLAAPATMQARVNAYQQSLRPPGYQRIDLGGGQGYETIDGVPVDPSRRLIAAPTAPDEWESVSTSEHPVAANEGEESKRRSGQPYLTAEGTIFNPAMQVKKPRISLGATAPVTALAQTLASPGGITQPTGGTSALQVPTFLSELSAGRNVGQARQMPTFGFPQFASAQGYQSLTAPEQEILQSEVKAQGGYWPQYAREMQKLWPTWSKRGAFTRQPSYMGV